MISDDDIVAVLPAPVVQLAREPYEYATSFVLERVQAELGDGRTLDLILKDLTWEQLLPDAGRSKPAFLYEPRREIETYRRMLPLLDVGPDFYGAGNDWLLIEKVEGIELWQTGDLAVWEDVARWTADFHVRAAMIDTGECSPYLLRYGAEFLGMWAARASVAVDSPHLAQIADGYGVVVDALASLPASFIHGELYPSNVLIGDRPKPVDWEMAAVGPPLLDVVALTTGWADPERDRLVRAYVEAADGAAWITDDLDRVLDCCRLHYAMQWLGWSSTWSPPREHARDWLQVAFDAADRLGL